VEYLIPAREGRLKKLYIKEVRAAGYQGKNASRFRRKHRGARRVTCRNAAKMRLPRHYRRSQVKGHGWKIAKNYPRKKHRKISVKKTLSIPVTTWLGRKTPDNTDAKDWEKVIALNWQKRKGTYGKQVSSKGSFVKKTGTREKLKG